VHGSPGRRDAEAGRRHQEESSPQPGRRASVHRGHGARRVRRENGVARPRLCDLAPRAAKPPHQGGAPEKVEDPGPRLLRRGELLEPEALRPGDERLPEELVHREDHDRHRDDGPEHGAPVALLDGDGHVGADAGQAKVAVPQGERLVDGQEEPPSGHRHHRVPDEADDGRGHLHGTEGLEPSEAVDPGDLSELGGDRTERPVEREHHVPDLAGEDHEDAGELEAHVGVREERDHAEDQAGQEPEHRNPLPDVEKGNHDALGALGVRGHGSIDQREQEREDVGGESPRQGEQRVHRERAGAQVDRGRRPDRRVPSLRERHDARDQRGQGGDQEEIDGESAGAAQRRIRLGADLVRGEAWEEDRHGCGLLWLRAAAAIRNGTLRPEAFAPTQRGEELLFGCAASIVLNVSLSIARSSASSPSTTPFLTSSVSD